MPKFHFDKIFIEARYNNALFFNDMSKLQLIIEELQSILPLSNFDSNQKSLILNNTEKHYTINIFANRFIVGIDELSSFQEFKQIADKVIDTIIRNLNLRTFNRIGMRSLRGIHKKNIGEANNYIKRNLFKFDDSALKSLGNNIKDTGISFAFDIDNYKAVLNIKAVSSRTIEIQNNIRVKDKMAHQVLVDSDIFKEGSLDVNKIKSDFITNVIEINNNKIDDFIKNVSVY